MTDLPCPWIQFNYRDLIVVGDSQRVDILYHPALSEAAQGCVHTAVAFARREGLTLNVSDVVRTNDDLSVEELVAAFDHPLQADSVYTNYLQAGSPGLIDGDTMPPMREPLPGLPASGYIAVSKGRLDEPGELYGLDAVDSLRDEFVGDGELRDEE